MKKLASINLDQRPNYRKFIITEPLLGNTGEETVWNAVCRGFISRKCFGYWRYPIFSQVGGYRKEADILIVDWELGLIIIEVKSLTIDQIITINGHRWEYQNFYVTSGHPYQQAEHQLYALVEYCHLEPLLDQQISGRVLVALPCISRSQWQQRQFDQLPSCPPLLFSDRVGHQQDDFQKITTDPPTPSLIDQIKQVPPLLHSPNPLSSEQWQLLQAVISGAAILRPPARRFLLPERGKRPADQVTRSQVLAQIRPLMAIYDQQQDQIGKQIPPGPQRIRGVAGSGKTVMLCQKAAQMHLKHPDWDIAFVFFSRSLYDLIRHQIDQWLRHFSQNRVHYDPDNLKLRILHGWGSQTQPGLYSLLCQVARVWRIGFDRTRHLSPQGALAEGCRDLLQRGKIPQIFDAILIDEGQDFLVEDELKIDGKQPFYWMAYQSLRPVEPLATLGSGGAGDTSMFGGQQLRRLIWAYDEMQSLATLKIPTASELFGDEFGHLVTGVYGNGIDKTEIMSASYRLPGQILTVAHGIAMGLRRPQGLLTGSQQVEDWQALGYQVIIEGNVRSTGELMRGETVTLKRENSRRNQGVSGLWPGSVIEFEAYRSRQEELTALADRILYNLRIDGLRPSREILVLVLGNGREAKQLQLYVANFLLNQGIDIFIPGTPDCNLLTTHPDQSRPNQFWCTGGVTVSRLHRAKGHEAPMVYVVGLDQVASDESNLTIRHQLFVAFTRSQAWLRISGAGTYPLYEELWQLIQGGDELTFTWKHPPQRDISITPVGEMLRRYQQGDRNFQQIDLAGVDLAGVDLRNANLIAAHLQGTILVNANLAGIKAMLADFSQADLRGANLYQAKLISANLSGANLDGACLDQADLTNTE